MPILKTNGKYSLNLELIDSTFDYIMTELLGLLFIEGDKKL